MTADDSTPGRGQDGDGQSGKKRADGASERETLRASLSSVPVEADDAPGGEVRVRGYCYEDMESEVVLTVFVAGAEVVLAFGPEDAERFARGVEQAAGFARSGEWSR